MYTYTLVRVRMDVNQHELECDILWCGVDIQLAWARWIDFNTEVDVTFEDANSLLRYGDLVVHLDDVSLFMKRQAVVGARSSDLV